MAAIKGNKQALGNKGRPRKFTPQQFEDACMKAIKELQEEGDPITLSAIYVKIGIWHDTFREYELFAGYEYSSICKKVRSICEDYIVKNGITNKNNPVFSMFLLKCKHGYVDKHEVKISENFDVEF